MKQLLSLTLIGLLILAGGCVTQYQKTGLTGGFLEKQLSRNEFEVGFLGNGYTSGQRAVDLCLLRCAELTLGHGFNHFALVARNAQYDESTAVTTGNYIATGYGSGVMISTTQVIRKPEVANRILCFRGKPAAINDLYDARTVYSELSQKYGVKKEMEQFPRFSLARAVVGFTFKVDKPRQNPNFKTQPPKEAPSDETQFIVDGFLPGSLAQDAGIQVGDSVLSFDGIPVLSGRFDEYCQRMEVGQAVQVAVRRARKEIAVSVTTIMNPAIRFTTMSDMKAPDKVQEQHVKVFEGSLGQIVAFPVAQYEDWEMPCETVEEFKAYAVLAAANYGANAVQILTSPELIKSVSPAANNRVGFLCGLMVVPNARINVELETGAAFQNRHVIRRIHGGGAEVSGLRIGDNILAIDGVDVLRDASLAARSQMKWLVGQTVQVTVARDGREVDIPVITVPND
jgi:hypothetical protein